MWFFLSKINIFPKRLRGRIRIQFAAHHVCSCSLKDLTYLLSIAATPFTAWCKTLLHTADALMMKTDGAMKPARAYPN